MQETQVKICLKTVEYIRWTECVLQNYNNIVQVWLWLNNQHKLLNIMLCRTIDTKMENIRWFPQIPCDFIFFEFKNWTKNRSIHFRLQKTLDIMHYAGSETSDILSSSYKQILRHSRSKLSNRSCKALRKGLLTVV
jgi:hypothetical protein